jgi:hypothetical protein
MHSLGQSGTEEETNSSLAILTVSSLPNVHWPPGEIWIDAGTSGVYMHLITRRSGGPPPQIVQEEFTV